MDTLTQLEVERNKNIQDLSSNEAILNRKKDELRTLTANLESYFSQREQLRAADERTKSELESINRQVSELETKILTLKQSNDSLQKESTGFFAFLRGRKKEIKAQIEDQSKQIQEAEEQIGLLTAHRDNISKSSSQEVIDNIEKEILSLQTGIETLEKDISYLENSISEIKQKVDELDKEISYQQNKIAAEKQAEKERLEKEIRKAEEGHFSNLLKEFNKFLEDYIILIQLLASIGTALAAIVAVFTLSEMQIERDNVYRPEFVVTPNSFEGKLLKKEELEIERNYIFLDDNASFPEYFYSDNFFFSESVFPMYQETCICLEKPYLTLKNIGQGTAKDIKVTFSSAWFESATDQLNYGETDSDGFRKIGKYIFKVTKIEENGGKEIVDIKYTVFEDQDDHEHPLANDIAIHKGIQKEKISYIVPDGSVRVTLPEMYCRVLSMFYYLPLEELKKNEYAGTAKHIKLPDLVITIEYLDMQEKKHSQEITIPWTSNYYYMGEYESSDWKPKYLEIKTAFFAEYLS